MQKSKSNSLFDGVASVASAAWLLILLHIGLYDSRYFTWMIEWSWNETSNIATQFFPLLLNCVKWHTSVHTLNCPIYCIFAQRYSSSERENRENREYVEYFRILIFQAFCLCVLYFAALYRCQLLPSLLKTSKKKMPLNNIVLHFLI